MIRPAMTATQTTTAAVMHAAGAPLEVREITVEPPRRGEVLVRMAASGVCHSDLHTLDGIQPFPVPVILGHEGAGIVEAVGPEVSGLRAGDHVMLSWVPYCGGCRMCAQGRPNLCEELAWSDAGTMMDGSVRFHADGAPVHHYTTSSFSGLSVVPAQSCIPVADDLPLDELALMGCAVMTGFGAVLNTARVRPGERVAVIGCGGVGLNVIQAAVVAGATTIVAVDVSERALDLAVELGATATVRASGAEAEAAIRRHAGGAVDCAFEALGRRETIELALAVAGRGGQTVLIGMAAPGERASIDPLAITLEERVVRGSWYGSCRPIVDFPVLVDLYRAGRIRLGAMTEPIGLRDINRAFDLLRSGRAGRSVVVF
jgi:S-(hydroxymethyl)glutathione dehydrogenase/alcohol dehydrogenase